jgi:cell fate (sporulation/competence/biofilm development) regulator YmcA (YheA/YmcA/DUF963 family)
MWKYNSKLCKIAKAFNHTKFIECDTNRSYFTKHGLHFSKYGKAYLAKQMASTVQLLFERKTNTPLVLGWLSNTSVHNDLLVVDTSIETTAVQSKNTHMLASCNNNWANRTSKRSKKLPRTRTNYFLWQI